MLCHAPKRQKPVANPASPSFKRRYMHVKFQGKVKDVKSNVSEAGDGKTSVNLIADVINQEASAYLYAIQKLPQNASRELWVTISENPDGT